MFVHFVLIVFLRHAFLDTTKVQKCSVHRLQDVALGWPIQAFLLRSSPLHWILQGLGKVTRNILISSRMRGRTK